MNRKSWLFIMLLLVNQTVLATPYVGASLLYESIRKASVRYIGLTPRLFFGYAETLRNQLQLAGELFASPVKPYTISSAPQNTAGLKPAYSFGASLLPQYVLDDYVTIFVRLGVISMRFNDYDVTRGGYQIGAGIETPFCNQWSMRGEYNYYSYHQIANLGSPNEDQYALSMIYHFF